MSQSTCYITYQITNELLVYENKISGDRGYKGIVKWVCSLKYHNFSSVRKGSAVEAVGTVNSVLVSGVHVGL